MLRCFDFAQHDTATRLQGQADPAPTKEQANDPPSGVATTPRLPRTWGQYYITRLQGQTHRSASTEQDYITLYTYYNSFQTRWLFFRCVRDIQWCRRVV